MQKPVGGLVCFFFVVQFFTYIETKVDNKWMLVLVIPVLVGVTIAAVLNVGHTPPDSPRIKKLSNAQMTHLMKTLNRSGSRYSKSWQNLEELNAMDQRRAQEPSYSEYEGFDKDL